MARLYSVILLLLSVCLSTGCAVISHEARQDAYTEARETKGLVIVAVYWGSRWEEGCRWSTHIDRLAFTRLPVTPSGAGLDAVSLEAGDFDWGFRTYALLLEPGEYALSNFSLEHGGGKRRHYGPHVWYPLVPCTGSKCPANTPPNPIGLDDFTAVCGLALDGKVYGIRPPPSSQCRYKDCSRYDRLIQGKAGSFEVKAGESVYIGNFWVNCDHGAPMLWRYYTQKGKDFLHHLERARQKYPFIDPARVVYRLFETDYLGDPYDPNAPSMPPEPRDRPPKGKARSLEREAPPEK